MVKFHDHIAPSRGSVGTEKETHEWIVDLTNNNIFTEHTQYTYIQ
jgi:hypothetical protein